MKCREMVDYGRGVWLKNRKLYDGKRQREDLRENPVGVFRFLVKQNQSMLLENRPSDKATTTRRLQRSSRQAERYEQRINHW